MPGRITELSESQIIADVLADLRRHRTNAISHEPIWTYDTYTISGSSDTAHTLTYVPYGINVTLLNGLGLTEGTDYTADYTTGVVTVTATLTSGDVLHVRYVTNGDLIALSGPVDIGTTSIVVPWNATGWKYKQITASDATDYSSPAYVDSAWSTGQAPFGSDNQGGTLNNAWGGYNTAWALDTRIWLRKALGALPGGATTATVYVRIDNFCDIYWNGHLLGSFSHTTGSLEDYGSPYNVAVPSAYIDTVNQLAIRYTDDSFVALPSIDCCFADCLVTT